MFRRLLMIAVACLPLAALTAPARAIDTGILTSLDYNGLQWQMDPEHPGSWYAVVSGDPSQPGRYVILNRVLKGNFNRPHAHSDTRQIYVVQGTWWVGSGTTLNPDASIPMPAGSIVVHQANQVHWDGAKTGDVLLLIEGDGPATEYEVN